MNRIPKHFYAEAIATAYYCLPDRIADRLQSVDFLCGVDPLFVGLHSIGSASDGRSYSDTAHCVYDFHQMTRPADGRKTTIVLPDPRCANILTVWHELGHALHETIGFDCAPRPINEYAGRNKYEAFAEAFCAWRSPWYAGDLAAFDPETHELFEFLAA